MVQVQFNEGHRCNFKQRFWKFEVTIDGYPPVNIADYLSEAVDWNFSHFT